MYTIYLRAKYHISIFKNSLDTRRNTLCQRYIFTAAVLLSYILQKYYLNRICILFENLLPCVIVGPENVSLLSLPPSKFAHPPCCCWLQGIKKICGEGVLHCYTLCNILRRSSVVRVEMNIHIRVMSKSNPFLGRKAS